MSREITYVLMDPSGNRTALVETPLPAGLRPGLAARLMEREPSAEQVGFLSGDGLTLHMAGGEFCGNASMSAAALYVIRAGLAGGRVTLNVSGAPEPVAVDISPAPDGAWQGTVGMPRPDSVENVRFPDGAVFPVVAFPGIVHVILEGEVPGKADEERAKRWCRFLGADALGLMFFDREARRLTPLVYVPAAGTLCWESACGSGTSAVGAWLATGAGETVTVSLTQPGGTLDVSAAPDGTLFLRGTVRYLYEKTLTV